MGVLRDDLLVPLGAAVVSRGGRTGPGRDARGRPSHRLAGRRRRSRCGTASCSCCRWGAGQVAELEIELGAGGDPRRGRARARRVQATVSGGAVGLVLDARDAPLILPRRSDDRRAVLAGWRDTFLREPTAPIGRSSA